MHYIDRIYKTIFARRLLIVCLVFVGCVLEAYSKPSDRVNQIVVFKDSVSEDLVEARAAELVQMGRTRAPSLAIQQISRRKSMGNRNVDMLEKQLYRKVFSGFVMNVKEQELGSLKSLRHHPDVAFVAPDLQLEMFAQVFLPGMERIRVRSNATANVNDIDDGNVDVDIAVLDTGIDAAHSDLNVYRSVSFVPEDQGDGDPHGHGTHVSGIAAAIDDSVGVYGVAPGARLWSVKVLNQGGWAPTSQVISALEYVLEHADEIEVVNMSLGGFGSRDDQNCGWTTGDPLHVAICGVVDAGVVVVAAAGNSKVDSSLVVPASYDEVITVSAVIENNGEGPDGEEGPYEIWGADNTFAQSFSNFGWDVDLAAPGVNVHSTVPGGAYANMTGTSMAAPHVAGAAALWIVKNGKPVDAEGVKLVRDELVRLAFPQRGFDNGFSNDQESYTEPLLDVGAIDLVLGDPLEPRLSSNKYVYAYNQDTQATISVRVEDEYGNPVLRLPSNSFVPFLQGDPVTVGFSEQGAGVYELTLDIRGLWPGTYDFHCIVRNMEGFERTAGVEIRIHAEDPAILITALRPVFPVLNPYGFITNAYFVANVVDHKGIPVMLTADQFETFYAGGDDLVWKVGDVSHGQYKSQAYIYGFPMGTYDLDLTVTDGSMSDSASTSLDLAIPEPAISAALTTNAIAFDFTQSIPPPLLELEVWVESELELGFVGLLSYVTDPITVLIDGEAVNPVEFVEEEFNFGNYQSTGIDLRNLSHGKHALAVHVSDPRGLETVSNSVNINVIREVEDKSVPLLQILQRGARGK